MESISSIIAFLQLGLRSASTKDVGSIGAHHMQFLDHQCMWRKPKHREDVAHAVEVKRCVVIMVGIQVLIVNIIVHLHVTGSSWER
jgi:hypothetical protein